MHSMAPKIPPKEIHKWAAVACLAHASDTRYTLQIAGSGL